MKKTLHAVELDGTTFSMPIDTQSRAYACMKSKITEDEAIDYFGKEFKILSIGHLYVAALMGSAHWLVSDLKYFRKIQIDGLKKDEWIYVKYDENQIDFRFQHKEEDL